MKKIHLLIPIVFTLLLAGCNFPGSKGEATQDLSGVNPDALATAVQQTLDATLKEATATPEGGIELVETATFTPEVVNPTITLEPTQTPTYTPTVSADDPVTWLGTADWTAEFEGSVEGFYDGDDENTVIEVQNGALTMVASMLTKGWHTWSLNYRTIQDFYYEAEINLKQCSGVDEYGLVFRSPDYSSGYFFAVRCNGEYSLRAYNGEYTNIISWQYSEAVNTGSNQSNRLGVYVTDDLIKLYINGTLVDEANDAVFPDAGHFGFLIAAYEIPGFRVEVDRARYWTLD